MAARLGDREVLSPLPATIQLPVFVCCFVLHKHDYDNAASLPNARAKQVVLHMALKRNVYVKFLEKLYTLEYTVLIKSIR